MQVSQGDTWDLLLWKLRQTNSEIILFFFSNIQTCWHLNRPTAASSTRRPGRALIEVLAVLSIGLAFFFPVKNFPLQLFYYCKIVKERIQIYFFPFFFACTSVVFFPTFSSVKNVDPCTLCSTAAGITQESCVCQRLCCKRPHSGSDPHVALAGAQLDIYWLQEVVVGALRCT